MKFKYTITVAPAHKIHSGTIMILINPLLVYSFLSCGRCGGSEGEMGPKAKEEKNWALRGRKRGISSVFCAQNAQKTKEDPL